DIDALVEALRRHHGAARAEAELARGLLLQGRGGEGRLRVALDLAPLDLGDGEARSAADLVGCRPRGRLGREAELVELLAVEMGEAREEALARGGAELDLDRPVFARLERLDLGLALADEAERHGLHAARRLAA